MKEYLINKRLKELCKKRGYLSNEENLILFEEYEQFKLNNIPVEDIIARTLLILGNTRLIYFVLKKEFDIYGQCENSDEFSYGRIGLIKAVDT